MDEVDPFEGKLLLNCCTEFFKRIVEPLNTSEMMSFEEYLSMTSYSNKLKDHFRTIRTEFGNKPVTSVNTTCKSFIKSESYGKPKWPRWINSPDDVTKAVLGPFIKSVEKKFFKAGPWFIKGTDPKELPDKLRRMFGDSTVVETDFTAFESHHRGMYTEILLRFFYHMLRNTPENKAARVVIRKMVKGKNVCRTRHLEAHVDQRLMSGVLWTSLGNAVLNLCIMSFLRSRSLRRSTDVNEIVADMVTFNGLIEGDDGICEGFRVDQGVIDRLGLKLKLANANFYGDASFCGNVCARDSDTIVPDPLKVLRTMPLLGSPYTFANEKKQKGLMRAKAMSYKYMYANAPVVGAYCDWILEQTSGHDIRGVCHVLDNHKRGLVDLAMNWRLDDGTKGYLAPSRPSCADRELCEKRFGISIEEQLAMERCMKGKGPVYYPLEHFMSDDQVKHGVNFYTSEPLEFSPSSPPPEYAHKLSKLAGVGSKRVAREAKFTAEFCDVQDA